jgi:hypothetical protein
VPDLRTWGLRHLGIPSHSDSFFWLADAVDTKGSQHWNILCGPTDRPDTQPVHLHPEQHCGQKAESCTLPLRRTTGVGGWGISLRVLRPICAWGTDAGGLCGHISGYCTAASRVCKHVCARHVSGMCTSQKVHNNYPHTSYRRRKAPGCRTERSRRGAWPDGQTGRLACFVSRHQAQVASLVAARGSGHHATAVMGESCTLANVTQASTWN